MALNQKNKRLGKFLDFIGLVDTEKESEGNYSAAAPRSRSNARPASRSAAPVEDDMDDLFDESPAPRRSAPRQSAPRAGSASRYESGDDWMESGRIDYRSQSSRYSAPRASTQSRYSSAPSYEDAYRSTARSARNQPLEYGMEGERRNPYRQTPPRAQTAAGVSRMADDLAGDEYESYDQAPSGRHQMVVYDLHTVNECKDVILALLAKKSVLVNLVSMNQETAQRALDTLSGATFAISAKISRASDTTWLFTPSNVEVASLHGEEPGRKYY